MKHPIGGCVYTCMRGMVLFVMLALIFGCDTEDNNPLAKLELVFQLKYDGELLTGPNNMYELNDSVKMRFSKVSYYVSDFRLSDDGQTFPLLDILHISFLQDINGDAISAVEQKLSFEIPTGNYESLSFGLGLTPAQNSTTPADHEAGSALSLSSEYWPSWNSYIYEKLEGSYQLNDGDNQSVALHVGGDETYRVLEWNNDLSIAGGETKLINIPIDLKNILESYPITESPVLHKLEQLPLMEMIADGFAESMN